MSQSCFSKVTCQALIHNNAAVSGNRYVNLLNSNKLQSPYPMVGAFTMDKEREARKKEGKKWQHISIHRKTIGFESYSSDLNTIPQKNNTKSVPSSSLANIQRESILVHSIK